jgi:hypothetical protein
MKKQLQKSMNDFIAEAKMIDGAESALSAHFRGKGVGLVFKCLRAAKFVVGQLNDFCE